MSSFPSSVPSSSSVGLFFDMTTTTLPEDMFLDISINGFKNFAVQIGNLVHMETFLDFWTVDLETQSTITVHGFTLSSHPTTLLDDTSIVLNNVLSFLHRHPSATIVIVCGHPLIGAVYGLASQIQSFCHRIFVLTKDPPIDYLPLSCLTFLPLDAGLKAPYGPPQRGSLPTSPVPPSPRPTPPESLQNPQRVLFEKTRHDLIDILRDFGGCEDINRLKGLYYSRHKKALDPRAFGFSKLTGFLAAMAPTLCVRRFTDGVEAYLP
eukprot:GILJ01011415.1.p1 GENE.GILJ01011415.1~~GILJ01011415.1.p1  ORF type:complete len:275 (+),score=22.50 GILJ01011415.1:31-825(+)